LQASEAKFRDLFDMAPDMFVSVDARSGAITECNQTLLDKLGYSKEELIGRPTIDIYHPRCHARAEQCTRSFLETGTARADELQLFARNGDVIDVSLNVSAIRDADGNIVRSRSILRDVSERNRAEKKLRQRAAYQALLVDLSAQLICARSSGLDAQLDYCLERIGAGYGLDAISLWWLTGDRGGIRQVRRWERSEARDLPGYRHRAESHWLAAHLKAGETIVVNDLLEMPRQAASEREEFRRWGTKSFAMIPMLVDGKPEGVVFLSTLRYKRLWSPDDISELKLVSDTLAGAIARSEAMAEIESLKNRLQEENVQLRDEILAAQGFDEIIGNNARLKRSLRLVEKVAPTDVAVLILGQTGTGKELIARAVHRLSARRDQPMVSVNCPALPSNLIESELFGHEKGAFTGAHSRRKGRFELASGGTLFLDELGDLPLDLQSKLLRVLQRGEFERLGGTETLRANVRLIAATNRDLRLAVDRGEFRADLYYRISNFPIQLPALC
ncbi:MAG: sigma 54-interacting transcriptional regulator, partial [Woeseia sp.]